MAHTRGPWFSYPETIGSKTDICIADKSGNVLADVSGEGETQLANARLMAASPRLLDALRECLKHIEGDEATHGRCFRAGEAGRRAVKFAIEGIE